MARPRTATNILEARGTFRANPQRKREGEPEVSSPFPSNPPASLTEAEADCWTEVVSIVPDGVLTGADTIQVEVVATLLSEWREDRVKFPTPKLTRMSSEMHKLGLNPSGRASLTVPKKDEPEF